MHLEGRIIYDFERIGDSPTCLGHINELGGEIGLVQGYGLTEENIEPGKLLETKVTILTNKLCQERINWRMEDARLDKEYKMFIQTSLPDGLNNHMLCTQGIRSDNGIYSVCIIISR